MRAWAAVATLAATVAILGVVALVVARGDPPAASPPSVEAAHANLVAEVDAIARESLGGLRWSVEPGSGVAACETPVGSPAGAAASASYGLEAPLAPVVDPGALADGAAQAWRRRGYESAPVAESDRRVAVFTAERAGQLLELVVDARRRRAFIGGSTPCLARRGGR
jgi:hypothetical protein